MGRANHAGQYLSRRRPSTMASMLGATVTPRLASLWRSLPIWHCSLVQRSGPRQRTRSDSCAKAAGRACGGTAVERALLAGRPRPGGRRAHIHQREVQLRPSSTRAIPKPSR